MLNKVRAHRTAKRVRRGNTTITNQQLFNALKFWANYVSSHGGKFKSNGKKVYTKNGRQITRQNMLNNLSEYLNARRIHLSLNPKNRKWFNVN